MFSVRMLQALRFWLYAAAILFAVIELIVDALALGALADYGFVSEHKGAAGWTMFVTVVGLITIPLIMFGNIMVSLGFNFIQPLNRILHELIVVVTLDVFYFVAGIVMANYAGGGGCGGSSVCSKFKAATAFPWLSFFVLLVQSVVLGLLLHIVRVNGGSLATPSYEIDGEFPVVAAAPPQHGTDPYPAPVQGAPSSYDDQPHVSMPMPAAYQGEKAV
ncbi:hypothetical protein J3B02_003650, partial [Coemansia erecta]|uniref:MARVEL domain-containing protein n=1 Tax=Coemansia asiatica TaxID=1052880 RepID=A0A9W7XMI4_9FUNG